MNASEDPRPLMAQYRAGLEAQLAMLRQLAEIAESEQETTRDVDIAALDGISDARDRVMASIVSLEAELQPLRRQLATSSGRLRHLAEFQALVALHKEAATLAGAIVSRDEHSMAALRNAELSRRAAAESLEKSESTLAAYRRVVAPSLASARLVNRRG